MKCLGLGTDFAETTSHDASSHVTSVFNCVFLSAFISQIVHNLMLISIARWVFTCNVHIWQTRLIDAPEK